MVTIAAKISGGQARGNLSSPKINIWHVYVYRNTKTVNFYLTEQEIQQYENQINMMLFCSNKINFLSHRYECGSFQLTNLYDPLEKRNCFSHEYRVFDMDYWCKIPFCSFLKKINTGHVILLGSKMCFLQTSQHGLSRAGSCQTGDILCRELFSSISERFTRDWSTECTRCHFVCVCTPLGAAARKLSRTQTKPSTVKTKCSVLNNKRYETCLVILILT